MKQYRTAQGKIVDMAALAAKNERVRAVGNMKVNGRGDTIDANGKIILPVTQKVGEKYQTTVGNRSAHARKSKPSMPKDAPVQSSIQKEVVPVPEPVKQELTIEEIELESLYNDDLEVENIKAKESKK